MKKKTKKNLKKMISKKEMLSLRGGTESPGEPGDYETKQND